MKTKCVNCKVPQEVKREDIRHIEEKISKNRKAEWYEFDCKNCRHINRFANI